MGMKGVGQCTVCNAVFVKQSGPQKYCEPCSVVKNDERRTNWAKANRRVVDPAATAARREKKTSTIVQAGAERSNASKRGLIWATDGPPPLVWKVIFSVPFSYSASKNHIYSNRAGGHVALRRESRALRDEIALKTKLACRESPVVNAKVWLDLRVQKPDHRGDAVNVIDLVCDGVKEGLGVDDRWFCIRGLDWQITKTDPQLIIGIGQSESSHRNICSHCGRILKLERFRKKSDTPLGVDRVCKGCHSATAVGREVDTLRPQIAARAKELHDAGTAWKNLPPLIEREFGRTMTHPAIRAAVRGLVKAPEGES